MSVQVHHDDISQVLILNKKSIASFEQELFRAELEKFRPHQNRLVAANHKQSSLMKELTSTYNVLLQDPRVRAEQSKNEVVSRQRLTVMKLYKQIYQDFMDLQSGLEQAKQWYVDMRDNVESLDKNIEAFVNNRRAEGRQLLDQIEKERASQANGGSDMEQHRLQELMERMSTNPSTSPNQAQSRPSPAFRTQSPAVYPSTNLHGQYQVSKSPPPQSQPVHSPNQANLYQRPLPSPRQDSFHNTRIGDNPGTWSQPNSPPANQSSFQQQKGPNIPKKQYQAPAPLQPQYIPPGYIPPPPPPGPPPLGPQQTIQSPGSPPMPGHGEYGYGPPTHQRPQNGGNDPWAGLNAWK